MPFDLTIWKEKTQDHLANWNARWITLRNSGTAKLYPVLAAAALWPLAEAVQADPQAAWMALGSILSGVGGNLLANVIQNWKDEATAARELDEAVAGDQDLRDKLDTVMEKLDVVAQARAALPESERVTFTAALQRELQQLGNLPRYQITLTGNGAVNTGSGNALGAGAMQIGGNVGGDVVAGNKTTGTDQRNQTVQNQTNIAGNQRKP